MSEFVVFTATTSFFDEILSKTVKVKVGPKTKKKKERKGKEKKGKERKKKKKMARMARTNLIVRALKQVLSALIITSANPATREMKSAAPSNSSKYD